MAKRASSALNAISPSMRASGAPMQWWMPQPKLSGVLSWRRRSSSSGSVEARGVAVGRALQDDDPVAAVERLAEQVGGFERRTQVELHGAVVAQELLDRGGCDVGMARQSASCSG